MLVRQQEQFGSLNEACGFLDNAIYLNESDSIYSPERVAIMENSEVGKYLIQLEDFVDYSLSNGIEDGSIALSNICEANKIANDDIGFTVSEVSVIEDDEMMDTVRELSECGFLVCPSSINESNTAYIYTDLMLEAALEADTEDDMDAILSAYIEDDEDLLSEAVIIDKVKEKAQQAGKSAETIFAKLKDTLQSAKSKSTNWISRKIASLRSLGRKWANSGHNAAKAVVSKINDCIGVLGQKLRNAKDSVMGGFGKAKSVITKKSNSLKNIASRKMNNFKRSFK